MASEGVTKTIIEFNAEGVKKGETRWENVKTNSNANVMASIGVTLAHNSTVQMEKKKLKIVGKILR